MKNKFAILIALLFIISSCEKIEFKHDLIGKWKIFGSGGGIHGQGASYNFNFMSIDHGNDYRFIRNDTIIERGTYQLVKNDIESFNGDYAIKFSVKSRLGTGAEQITSKKMIIEIIKNDSISLSDGIIDGYSYYFAKQ